MTQQVPANQGQPDFTQVAPAPFSVSFSQFFKIWTDRLKDSTALLGFYATLVGILIIVAIPFGMSMANVISELEGITDLTDLATGTAELTAAQNDMITDIFTNNAGGILGSLSLLFILGLVVTTFGYLGVANAARAFASNQKPSYKELWNTNGRFWATLGSLLVLGLIYFGIGFIYGIVNTLLLAMVGSGNAFLSIIGGLLAVVLYIALLIFVLFFVLTPVYTAMGYTIGKSISSSFTVSKGAWSSFILTIVVISFLLSILGSVALMSPVIYIIVLILGIAAAWFEMVIVAVAAALSVQSGFVLQQEQEPHLL